MPPHLAGRGKETGEFADLLKQRVVLRNLVLTGLRGVGKTVLMETFKPLAIEHKWLWIGTDLSESSGISEDRIAIRLLTDLSVVTSNIPFHGAIKNPGFGFRPPDEQVFLSYETLTDLYAATPGLPSDKLKNVLEMVWDCMKEGGAKGIIFAYDEAQTLSDHSKRNEFPLSLLLDVFQSIQKKEIPYLLVLTGLPMLFPKLVEARTYAERMFHIMFLDRLNEQESRDAIQKPIEKAKCPVSLTPESIKTCVDVSGGYPYFIQFICREVYDVFVQQMEMDGDAPLAPVPIAEITRKLDADFFSGRWARVTDRQRELLKVIAHLPNCDDEFTVQEVAEKTKDLLSNPFSPSHINQMLATLNNAGMVYKNRHGKYSLAVPMLGQFILRQIKEMERRTHQKTLFP